MVVPVITCNSGCNARRFSPNWWLSKLLQATRLGMFVRIQRSEYAILHTPSDVLKPPFSATRTSIKMKPQSDRSLTKEIRSSTSGANVGSTTLFAAAVVGPSGRVVAVEPHPRTFAYLSANVDLNPNLRERITIRRVAVADTASTVSFSSGYHDSGNHVCDAGDGLRVETVSLDDLCRDIRGRIGLLKIDVEGYETTCVPRRKGDPCQNAPSLFRALRLQPCTFRTRSARPRYRDHGTRVLAA